MASRVLLARGNWRHWPRVIGSGMAGLLLTAVPALGIFYDKWIIRQSQTGGAPKAAIDTSNPLQLLVDMGVNGRPNSTSTVVARRQFVVPVPLDKPSKNSGERLFVNHSFTTVLKDGSVEVITTRIMPCAGPARLDRFFQNVDRRVPRTIGADHKFNRFLTPGFYTLEITIRYLNRHGFWDNHSSGSPHRFAISSV